MGTRIELYIPDSDERIPGDPGLILGLGEVTLYENSLHMDQEGYAVIRDFEYDTVIEIGGVSDEIEEIILDAPGDEYDIPLGESLETGIDLIARVIRINNTEGLLSKVDLIHFKLN